VIRQRVAVPCAKAPFAYGTATFVDLQVVTAWALARSLAPLGLAPHRLQHLGVDPNRNQPPG